MSHVFVTQGDLRRFWCDAWLMPTGPAVFIVPYWFTPEVAAALGERLRPAPFNHRHITDPTPESYEKGDSRTFRFPDYPGSDDGPQPWLTNVGGGQRSDPAWYVEGVEEFVRRAAADGARATGRTRPLLAMPLVGTGAGGKWFEKAEMTQALLPELHRMAAQYEADIALVTYDDGAFAAAQVTRRHINCGWPELTDTQRDAAQALARRAVSGELVLFLGAGVSMSAGLPSWQGLLEDLADSAGMNPAEVGALGQLAPADQARLVERRLGGREQLLQAIRTRLDVPHYALSHTLCARLPADTSVTLNYDRLFERASTDQGHAVRIIPQQGGARGDRALLKLHGCISSGEDVVLTREDYLRFGDRRSALAGFVQALLITHHVLFIGFGLADDNFHRILDDVRKVLGEPTASDPFVGSVLTLLPEPLRDELWGDEMRIIPMSAADELSLQDAARRLDIFLDYVVFLTGQRPRYLLNATYDALLTDTEREFRDDLLRMHGRYARALLTSPLGEEFREFIRRLGGADERD